jgi:hypothetical protein
MRNGWLDASGRQQKQNIPNNKYQTNNNDRNSKFQTIGV